MKNSHFISLAAALTVLSCGYEAQPVQYESPEVVFPMEAEVIDATVGEPVTFTASVIKGDKVSCAWYIDDVLEAASENFSYIFTEPGNHFVRFEAMNGANSVERTYTVIVADVFKVTLSTLDSTQIFRTRLNRINVAAIVEAGSDITHLWTLDGVEAGNEAYFGAILENVGEYAVTYHGKNSRDSLDMSFTVKVKERPLEMSFSIRDEAISIKKKEQLSITATPLFGGDGLVQSWTVDGVEVETGPTLSWSSPEAGQFTIEYTGTNALGETVTRQWRVDIVQLGYMLDDFESGTELKSWYTLKQNTPGVELANNPDKSGINTSSKCLKDSVTGAGGTSGYFDIKIAVLVNYLEGEGIDLTQFNSIRMKVHLGKNQYYPRIQVGETKYTPVDPPKFNNEWEELVYVFPSNLNTTQSITFRPLLQQNGSNISGAVSETNTRCVYIDDIELLN